MKKPRTLWRLAPVAALLASALAAPAQAQSLLELYESARSYDASWQSAKAQYDANLYRAEREGAPQIVYRGDRTSLGVEISDFVAAASGKERALPSAGDFAARVLALGESLQPVR